MRFILGLMLVSLTVCGCGGGGNGSGGGSSGTDPAPAPVISSVSPDAATVGGAAFTLTVNGSNFVSASAVNWNGAGLATTYVGATQLTAQVPAANIASAGTANITVVNPSADGGTSGAATFSVGTAQGSAPQLVQHNVYQTQGNATEVNSTLQFASPTKAGDLIWVAVTVSDFAGAHQISISDTQNNVYTLLDQENDGQPGTQTVAHFYAANIAGDGAAPDTVTVTWTTDDYKGILVAEISGATSTPLVGHAGNIQDGLAAGTGNVTAGPISVASAQVPALLVALSMNTTGGSGDTGGSGRTGPTAGSGMTQVGMIWNWGANLATFATEQVTSPESISAAFNSLGSDSFVTVAAVFH